MTSTASETAQEAITEVSNHDLASPYNTASIAGALIESMPPYLQTLYRETVRLRWLTRMGKLIKAWIDMPRLVRLAQLDRCEYCVPLEISCSPKQWITFNGDRRLLQTRRRLKFDVVSGG